ncbi:iron complex transport system substrate-binding protein [Alkalihalobacillus xiaoxiensis]|uniref:Iron complex transport system substrate-binding protein n=1 Tax=Shouchella xiaoxiensis TaxID=766895 RepID=A0ABS2STM7_9BACI|nr:ABC transporter substrate-binding protein [Shouchella xiaoxiensis]MBM7838852.1 iron complex transport system substrate-binding protein [Shouchella xiaoxiensis]
MNKSTFFGAVCLVIMLAGCQTTAQEKPVNSTSESAAYTVTDFADRDVTFADVPERIAVLGNGELDIVYALGEEVAGRPTGHQASIVSAAEEAVQVGSYHEADSERLMLAKPDVIFANYPMNLKDVQTLESSGAKVILTSANSVDEIKNQIELIGEVVQKSAEAEELIDSITKKEEQLQEEALHSETSALLVYGAPGSNLIALPQSLAGSVLDGAGGVNTAATFEQLQEYPQYAALSPERVIEEDPDVVLFMAHGDPTNVQDSFEQEMNQHAGWSQLPAVQEGRMHILPADLFGTNPGTRIIDALDYMYEKLKDVQQN